MATSQQLAAFNYAVPGPLVWNPVKSASFNAVAGNAYPLDTTSNTITVTLPASPTAGQIVQIIDYAGKFNVNACTVNPNGSKIGTSSSGIILALIRESIALVYIDTIQGWIPYSGLTSNILSYTASYLVVSGGGGGGANDAAGGGAGGVLSGTITLSGGII